MKKIIVSLVFLLITGMTGFIYGQGDPALPPDNPNMGNGNEPVGGGAPIGGGLVILLALGAGYGGKKIYDFRKKNNALEEL